MLILIYGSSICDAIIKLHGYSKKYVLPEQIFLQDVAYQEQIACI